MKKLSGSRERDYVVKVLAVLDQYGDSLSKSDICLLADESQNASYIWGIIDALIGVGYIHIDHSMDDMRFVLCRISTAGQLWLKRANDDR